MIAIVVPTLNRPHLLGPLAMNVHQTTKVPYTLLFVVDRGDTATHNTLSGLGNATMVVCDGTYPEKINAGVQHVHEPAVVLANDDVVFYEGWFTAANLAFIDGIEVVGPSDTTPATENEDHATMPIVRRSYIDDPGAVWGERGTTLYEGYHHNFSETELWQLAVDRGVAKFVPECVIEHRHPDWGTAGLDETYQVGARTGFEDDQELFFERQAAWRA